MQPPGSSAAEKARVATLLNTLSEARGEIDALSFSKSALETELDANSTSKDAVTVRWSEACKKVESLSDRLAAQSSDLRAAEEELAQAMLSLSFGHFVQLLLLRPQT